MSDILQLKDGQQIQLQSGASLSAMSVLSENKQTMVETWDKLTDENLSDVQILNGSELVVGIYTNLTLVSETSTINEDGTILTRFNLREKTQQELEMEELKNAVSDLQSDMEVINETVGGE